MRSPMTFEEWRKNHLEFSLEEIQCAFHAWEYLTDFYEQRLKEKDEVIRQHKLVDDEWSKVREYIRKSNLGRVGESYAKIVLDCLIAITSKEKDEEIANLKKLNTGILNILDRKQSELDRANEKVKVLDELKSVKQPKEK